MTPDLTQIPNDGLMDLTRRLIREWERRLAGHPVLLGMVRRLHSRGNVIEQALFDNGDITTLSDGGGKDGP